MTDIPPPFDALWFRLLLGIVIGLALGSFTTMLSYRLPRGLSIVHPRSRCPSCGTALGARDLVPVFSWLVMRGKCRHCGTNIGRRYLLIEIATTAASAAAFGIIGFRELLVPALAGIVCFITAIICSLEHR